MTAPRVTVFTPSHQTRWLDEAYTSLQAQTVTDWEWRVLLNGKASAWTPPQPDPRVHVSRAPGKVRGVGALKRAALADAAGAVYVELDHDDVLAPACLQRVLDTVAEQPSASLIYSDFAQINDDGTPNDGRFNLEMGWSYDPVEIAGVTYDRCAAMAPLPANVGFIWYAPNHVRAVPRWAYEQVGGFDADLAVLDDHELMLRLFEAGPFAHIPELLYLQRWHPHNTQTEPATNAFIQDRTVAYFDEWIERLALAHATRHGQVALTLTTPTSVGDPPGDPLGRYQPVVIDPARPVLPVADSSVGIIRATDVLQRVPDRAALLNECYRVLGHGGLLYTETPSTDGRGAFQDPSHVAFYNENSFAYLTQAVLRPTIPTLTARLQLTRLRTWFPSDVHERMRILYVQAVLAAVKDGPRLGGLLLV